MLDWFTMITIHRPLSFLACCTWLALAVSEPCQAQETIRLDASSLLNSSHSRIDCTLRAVTVDGQSAVEVVPNGSAEQQLLVLRDASLETGTLEFEFHASTSSSFVGLAWHAEGPKNYEAIYFRPFRFRDPDPVGKRHAIQYVSHPDYPWRRLRTEFPDIYEAACPIDSGQWVQVRIEVETRRVRVFVQDLKDPILVVDRPWVKPGRGVALWTGAGTRGAFRNVTVRPNATVEKAMPSNAQARNLLLDGEPGPVLLAGDWKINAQGLQVQPSPFAQWVLPGELPADYDLEVEWATRSPAQDSLSIFLPLGTAQVALQFGANGTHDGLGLVRGQPAWVGSTSRPTFLRAGQRQEALIQVRSSVSPARIRVINPGAEDIFWEGPTSDLGLFRAFRIPPRRAGLGAHNMGATFHQVRLKPPGD